MMKVLVLGLGNTLLTDDGIGIYVARELEKIIDAPNVTIEEASVAGFNIIDLVQGYDVLILIDAVQAEGVEPGEICQLETDSLMSTARLNCVHQINLATALQLGLQLGCPMPEIVEIYAIGTTDTQTFGEKCTPAVEQAIPKITRILADRVQPYVENAICT